MKSNLLIVGAGLYGLVAKEIAESMGRFGKIGFIDDNAKIAPNGKKILGKFSDAKALCNEYDSVIVAIGNPDARLSMLEKLKNDNCLSIVTLISPLAYISPTADIAEGCIIEPMAVVHIQSVLYQEVVLYPQGLWLIMQAYVKKEFTLIVMPRWQDIRLFLPKQK